MLSNKSHVISIQTRVTLPGLMLNSTAILNVDGKDERISFRFPPPDF